MKPLVVGPEGVPVVEDAEVAESDPELALLSVMAHSRSVAPERALRMATVTVGALRGLAEERAVVYFDVLVASLGEATRRALEESMDLENWVFQSDYFKRRIAEVEQKRLAEGRAGGLAEALLFVLQERGLDVSEEQRAAIVACSDAERLSRWIRRAAAAGSTADVLAG